MCLFVGQVGDCEVQVRGGEAQKHADYMDVYRRQLHSKAGEKIPVCIERGEQRKRVSIKNICEQQKQKEYLCVYVCVLG